MRIENFGNYLRLLPNKDEQFNPYDFLGWKHDKSKIYYTVENNIINRIVLGLFPESNNVELPTLQYPEGLMEFQYRDVQKMVANKRCLNINRMGYGKTVEAIKAMRELGIENAVIVAPKSVLVQWQTQIANWWPAKAQDVIICTSSATKLHSNNIVLLNYEKLLNKNIMTMLRSRCWDILVLDEAHRIKNRSSKRTVAAKLIPAQRKWGMTGTPILKKPDDLWSLLNFLGVEYSGISYWNFVNYFCKVSEGFFGNKIEGLIDNPQKRKVLRTLLEHIAIRNPDMKLTSAKTVEKVVLGMSNKQKKLYRDVKALLLDELPDDMTIANGAVKCLRLLQVTSTPIQWIDKEWGAKFEYIGEMLEDNPDEKLVVFSKFSTTCTLLKTFLNSKGIQSVVYTGSQDTADKALAKMTFINNASCRVLIGTIGALGEGVDGLQTVSRIAVFIDRDWSSEINKQCEDRLNRIGQKYPVLIQYLECKGTYDKYVDRLNTIEAMDIKTLLSREEDL